ncbi:MAG: hypothetical protein EAX96_17880 [Candidatus Lokiarchaeota archaeon]|nr:hypothetical protein [Candidatus Lokiarchaeota archaeon]
MQEELTRKEKKVIDYKIEAAELFVTGKYEESLALMKKLNRILNNSGRWEEADIYREKIIQIEEIIDERNDYIKRLKPEINRGDYYTVLRLYNSIAVISRALNDKESVEIYTKEFKDYAEKNQLDLDALDLRRELLEEKANQAVERQDFKEAVDLYGECEKISLLLVDIVQPEKEEDELWKAEYFRLKKSEFFEKIAKKH